MLASTLALALVACGAAPTPAVDQPGTPSAPRPPASPEVGTASLTLTVQGPPSAPLALWKDGLKVSQPSVSGTVVLTGLTRAVYRVEALDVAGYTAPAALTADLSRGDQTLTVPYRQVTAPSPEPAPSPTPTPTPPPAPQTSTLTLKLAGVASAPVVLKRAGVTVWSGPVRGSQVLPELERALYTVVPGAVSGYTAPDQVSADLSGGDVNATLTYTAVAPAPTPTPTPTPPPTPASDFEGQVLTLVNQARAQARTCGTQSFAATTPLAANDALRTAAHNHSQDMAVRNFFDHTNPDGVTFDQRITNAGYSWRAAAENIAAGASTPQDVVAGWLKSSGHCANIMNPIYNDLGVGYYRGGSAGHYWTQDFGAR